jgi:hypothetical protein
MHQNPRDNLKALIAHYQWLETLTDPVPHLASISQAKVAQWANEAQRLKARELREYVAPRRYALALAALRAARGRVFFHGYYDGYCYLPLYIFVGEHLLCAMLRREADR